MPELENKMRLQLFDNEFNMLSDRLVAQGPEFMKSPKSIHQGPLKIELSLFTQEEARLAVTYLQQLIGDLPIEAPKNKRGRKKVNLSSPTYREELVDHLSTMLGAKEVTDYLRNEGFVFTTLDFLEDLGNPIAIPVKPRKRNKWLVRLIRKAKNPLRNKYDLSVLVGFRGSKLTIFSGQDILLEHTLEDDILTQVKVPIKFKVKFPVYMQADERTQFRVQMDLLKKDPELKPSRLYTRWLGEVARVSPKEISFPLADKIPDMYEKGKTVQDVQTSLRDD